MRHGADPCLRASLAGPAHPAATAGFSIQQGEIPRETDCLLEGVESNFRFRDALSHTSGRRIGTQVGGFGPGGRIGSQQTHRWREVDSNHRFPATVSSSNLDTIIVCGNGS